MQIFMSFGLILSYHIHEPKEFPAFYCISTIVSSGPRPAHLPSEVVRWLVSDWREAHLLIADSTLGRTAIFFYETELQFIWHTGKMIIDEVTIRQQLHQKHSSSDLWRLVRAFASCSLFALMCYTHWPLTVTGRSKTMSQHRCGITSTWSFLF